MSKWSRRVAGETLGDPHLPTLRRTEQDQYTNDNGEKTKILVERFFPGTGQADLQDTSNQDYPIPLEISQTVTIKEIKDAIRKLSTEKAVGPDRILNKAIKAALEALTTPLANTAITCLLKGKLPECCKVTTTIIL